MDEKPSRLTTPLAVLLLVGAGLLATVAVALPLYQLTQPTATATLDVEPAAAERALATVPLPPQVVLAPDGADGLTVNAIGAAAPWQLRLLTSLGTSVWAAGLAVIAYLLARILANIALGEPFHTSHARRFTLIAVAIVVASAGADTVNLLTARAFAQHYGTPAALQVTAYYSVIPLALAAVTLVLAGAFRSGRRMAADVEGLI